MLPSKVTHVGALLRATLSDHPNTHAAQILPIFRQSKLRGAIHASMHVVK